MNRILALLCYFVLLLSPTIGLAKEPPNLSFAKKALIQYHDSGEYGRDQAAVGQKAMHYLEQRIKQAGTQRLAVVLDIDETSLSNYSNMHDMGFGGTTAGINKAMCEGVDPAIQPTLALYQFAKAHGVAVFFITGRFEKCRQTTMANLKKAGYENWDGLYFRPNDYHERSIVPYKANTRAAIEKQGYAIVLNVGDQESDLLGGHAEQAFKLPNPFYFLP